MLHAVKVACSRVARLSVNQKVMIVKWYREPLVHFLAIGALLFGIYLYLNDPYDSSSDARIEVSANDIELLRARWMKQWQRPPTANELRGLIEAHIREEVLYREALALGLDKDDVIVRRRMAQKMDFLVADVAVASNPGEAELRAYFEANKERYSEPAKLSFTHIYFNPGIRGSSAQAEAETVLRRLQVAKQPAQSVRSLGDRLMLAQDYVERGVPDVARDFGPTFAQRLIELEPGNWYGPIASGYGWHLVYIGERIESRLPVFATVKEKIKNDFLVDRRRELNDLAYQRLRERYQIVIAAPAESQKQLALQNEK